MQSIERFIGITSQDVKSVGPALSEAFQMASERYYRETHPKMRLLDNLILLSLAVFFIQVVYGVTFNRDPFNSFIAGLFCSLGTFALAASLRVQLTDYAFDNYADRKKIFEYCICSFLLYFASFLLMDDK